MKIILVSIEKILYTTSHHNHTHTSLSEKPGITQKRKNRVVKGGNAGVFGPRVYCNILNRFRSLRFHYTFQHRLTAARMNSNSDLAASFTLEVQLKESRIPLSLIWRVNVVLILILFFIFVSLFLLLIFLLLTFYSFCLFLRFFSSIFDIDFAVFLIHFLFLFFTLLFFRCFFSLSLSFLTLRSRVFLEQEN